MPPLQRSLAGRPLFINPLFYHPSITENVSFSRFPWSAARFGFTASLNATSKKEPCPSPSVASDSFEDGFDGDATQLDASLETKEGVDQKYRVEWEVEKPDEGYMGSDELDELGEDVEHELDDGLLDDREDDEDWNRSLNIPHDTCYEICTENSSPAHPTPNMQSHFSDTSESEESEEEATPSIPSRPEQITRRKITSSTTAAPAEVKPKRKRRIVLSSEDEGCKKRRVYASSSSDTTEGGTRGDKESEEEEESPDERPKLRLPPKRRTAPRRVNKFFFQ